jgi:hypothetical protein
VRHIAKKDETDSAGETQENENAGNQVHARIAKASFMWSKFDPEIRGVPPITREGVEFDASHKNSVEEKAKKAGVKLVIEDR